MTRRRTLVALSVASALLVALVAGELVARSAIDRRLSHAHIDGGSVRFEGLSALAALATKRVPIGVTFGQEAIADRFSSALGGSIDEVTLADGAVGVTTSQGVGRLRMPMTAWLDLSVRDGALTATVMSVEVKGFQLQPRALLGDDLDIPLGDPVSERCGDAARLDDVDVSPSGVTVHLTATPDMRACLSDQEDS